MSDSWVGRRFHSMKCLLRWINAAIWGKIEDWMFIWQRDRNEGCRGCRFCLKEGRVSSEGDMDGLFCNPLTCALFLTCTHKPCSAELSMAQKHAALLPTQPTLLCINSQRPCPHRLWTHYAFHHRPHYKSHYRFFCTYATVELHGFSQYPILPDGITTLNSAFSYILIAVGGHSNYGNHGLLCDLLTVLAIVVPYLVSKWFGILLLM